MPRSLQQVIDQADELARRFEQYEPSADDELDLGEHLLRRAPRERARSEAHVVDAVANARRSGRSWARIGAELDLSARAAKQRYSPAAPGRKAMK